MLIGALLGAAWLILLIRYPARALPISLGALLGLALVAAWVLWQEEREARRLSRLELRLEYAPAQCPGGQPLLVRLRNHNDTPLQSLRWQIAAYVPGGEVDLVTTYDAPRYRGPGDLQPDQEWRSCLPVPPLRPGYRASTLEFRAEALEGRFSK